ncbi:MAG: hypothetical protein ACI4XE_07215, partial [Acutalibacteraceae bacterium]
MKKTLSLVLALLMIFSVMSAVPFTASAQECSWDLYAGDTRIPRSQTDSTKDIYWYGSTVVLKNYTGTSLRAVPGGSYGNDDAPVFTIRLIGENTLTGESITDSRNNTWYGAVYAEPRQGGSGADSMIRFVGDGSLTINTKVSRPSMDIKAIVCGGSVEVRESTKVYVNYGGHGIVDHTACGVQAERCYLYGNAVLDVKATAEQYLRYLNHQIVSRIDSKCTVTGIDASVEASTGGYLSVDTRTNNTGTANTCVKGSLQSFNSTAVYLNNIDNCAFASGEVSLDKTDCYEFKLQPYFNYYAVTPKTSYALKAVSWKDLFAEQTYPTFGDAKGSFDSATFKLSQAGDAYYMTSSRINKYGYSVAGTKNFETYADSLFSFRTSVAPLPGYYVCAPDASALKYKSDCPVIFSTETADNGAYTACYSDVYYSYFKLIVTNQPTKYLCHPYNFGEKAFPELSFTVSIGRDL